MQALSREAFAVNSVCVEQLWAWARGRAQHSQHLQEGAHAGPAQGAPLHSDPQCLRLDPTGAPITGGWRPLEGTARGCFPRVPAARTWFPGDRRGQRWGQKGAAWGNRRHHRPWACGGFWCGLEAQTGLEPSRLMVALLAQMASVRSASSPSPLSVGESISV